MSIHIAAYYGQPTKSRAGVFSKMVNRVLITLTGSVNARIEIPEDKEKDI